MKIYCNNFSVGLAVFICLLISCRTKTAFDLKSEKVKAIITSSSDSINASKYFPDKDVRKYLHKEFDEFYKNRGYTLAWVTFDDPSEASDELLKAIDNADKEGLEPENYNLTKIEKLLKSIYDVESKKEKRKHRRAKRSLNKEKREKAWEKDTLKLYELVRLDFLLTSSYLTYASHLLSGKINPKESELWFSKPRKKDLSEHLEQAVSKNNIQKSLKELLPGHPQYDLLKKQLARLKKLEAIDTLQVAKSNQTNPWDDKVLIQKLKLLGDIDSTDSSINQKSIIDAIKHFQKRHGLEQNGKLDKNTLAALNWPLKSRVDQLKINLERMRWLPDDFGDRHILVNVPEYKMRVYEKDKTALEMKVIVGTSYNQTPIFSDSMEYIVFKPTWNVPRSIAVKEFLPKIKEDPAFLNANNYQLYDSWKDDAEPINCEDLDWDAIDSTNFNLRIVEAPGEKNSLGLVKFIFPNNLDVYLHDTPGNNLFDATYRSFSHGCVRLEKPFDLAEYLLKDKGWDRARIDEIIETKEEPETVLLSKKIPVHIVYWTAWIDDADLLNFRRDIYQHDKEQVKEIKKKEKALL